MPSLLHPLHLITHPSRLCQVVLRRPDGRVCVYSKGADNIMFERLSEKSRSAAAVLKEHLHIFAKVRKDGFGGKRGGIIRNRESPDDFFYFKAIDHHVYIYIFTFSLSLLFFFLPPSFPLSFLILAIGRLANTCACTARALRFILCRMGETLQRG